MEAIIQLSDAAIEALEMLAERPRETWKHNSPRNGWIGGRTAACLVRRGLAKYDYRNKDLTKIWDFDRKVKITDAGKCWLADRQAAS